MPADHSIQGLIATHSFLICPRHPRSRSRSPGPPSPHAPSLTDAEASLLIMQLAVARWKGASTFCNLSRLQFISINNRSHRYVD
jgi:hypothetical protein